MSETSSQEKVFNLTKELIDMQSKKKSMAQGYNAEIKRLKKEIEELIDPSKEKDKE